MKLVYTTLLTLLLLHLAGCNRRPQPVDVVNMSLENNSGRSLDWVRLEWEGPDVAGGIIPLGASATTVGIEWPNLQSATITFVDNETRERYNIKVSLRSANKKVQSGQCSHVKFRILDYDKAEVLCE